ncbi:MULTISPECIES: pentapeptide repeat-containing protein [unclassified Nocardia]|uniref:pentapeptide repeat-containing protein n=1 Tax=unclassified Nocardia TaxID=2637762 RepID=UPI0033BE9E5F
MLAGLGIAFVAYGFLRRITPVDANKTAAEIDVTRVALTVVAGVGGVVALVIAYRRQRDLEQSRFVERFGAAAAQLGATDVAVRIAGVYAMAGVADESEGLRRQQCIDVLCGYLRLPYSPELGANHQSKLVLKHHRATADGTRADDQEHHLEYRHNDREVRATIVRVIADHLRLTAEYSWSAGDFDFRTAHLEDVDFSRVKFSGAARFGTATFSGLAMFSGATFAGTTDFEGAIFSGTTRFGGATFSDTAAFHRATFSGPAWLSEAIFFGTAGFADAIFAGIARFDGAAFFGIAEFDGAMFSSPTSFEGSTFSGTAGFDGATFNSTTGFDGAIFSSIATFDRAAFSGSTTFDRASFSSAMFSRATFADIVRFVSASFSGVTGFDRVTFAGAASFAQVDFGTETVSFVRPEQWGPPAPVFDWDQDFSRKPANVEPAEWPPALLSAR